MRESGERGSWGRAVSYWTMVLRVRDHGFKCYEANTRHSRLRDIPCHRSGDCRRLRPLADLPMACCSTAAEGGFPRSWDAGDKKMHTVSLAFSCYRSEESVLLYL